MIAVFDSGLGGLSVLKALRESIPHQIFYYLADSVKAPYGEKSSEFIQERCRVIFNFFMQFHPDAIVIACNTATAQAIDILRLEYNCPIIGVEPGIKPACELSLNKIIGVLATKSTLASPRYERLCHEYGQGVKFISIAGIGLVEQIEKGYLYAPKTYELCEKYCEKILSEGADTIVLGCTHYSFLIPIIRTFIPKEITLIDTPPAIANHTAKLCNLTQVFSSTPLPTKFFTTGDSKEMTKILHLLRIYEPEITEIIL